MKWFPLAGLLMLCLAVSAHAQALTPAQLQTLKTDIAANTATVQFGGEAVQIRNLPLNDDANFEIAAWYNGVAAPDFWVWRTNVSREEIYNSTSPDSTTWNWTTYKNQAVAEQNAWVQMFMGDRANFSQPNLRAGIAAIFTGSAQANAQRDHCLAMGRRKSTRAEKLLATGTGSGGTPATTGFEGNLSFGQVSQARNLP